MPADSGPRAAISTRIGVINAPSWPRMDGFLINRPTIPHIAYPSPDSEELQVTLDFPGRDVALVLDPFHALQAQEFLGQLLADRLTDDFVGFQRIQRFVQVLR